jgi:hypothetical protein
MRANTGSGQVKLRRYMEKPLSPKRVAMNMNVTSSGIQMDGKPTSKFQTSSQGNLSQILTGASRPASSAVPRGTGPRAACWLNFS